MFICNCNGITERQVKAAAEAGARSWTDVHGHYGHAPQCGRCGVDIASYLSPASESECLGLTPALLAKS